jgi:hypothetical protein
MSLSPTSCARTLARGIRIRRCRSTRDGACHFLLVCRNGLVQLLRLRLLGRGRVPVINDLAEENGVERETSNEAVQDKRIVDFLKGGKDAREGTKEVVDNLCAHIILVTKSPSVM